MTRAGNPRFRLTLQRDICSAVAAIAIWAWLVSHWNVLWVVAIPAVVYQWRVNAALRAHHEPLTSLQKRWLFRFQPTNVRTWQGVGWARRYWVDEGGGPTYDEAHSLG